MFTRRSLILFIASAGVLFALSVILSGLPTGPVAKGEGVVSSYSPSVVGYEGFYEFLRQTEHPVARGTGDPSELAGIYGTVIVAEPDRDFTDEEPSFLDSNRLLLVLPKYEAYRGLSSDGWAEYVRLLDVDEVLATALAMKLDVQVVRQQGWSEWSLNNIGLTPSGEGDVQLIISDNITPIVAFGERILLGEIAGLESQKIWVLSDPDLLNNHGIFNGENALFITEAVRQLRFWANDDPNVPLVFDEAVHGYQESGGSALGLIFKFPYSVAAALIFVTALLMLFSGVGRFGPPAYKEELLDFGKERLISNSARLLDYSGHQKAVMLRYISMTTNIVARTLHAPSLKGGELLKWLDRVGTSRGIKISCVQVNQAVNGIFGEDKESLERLFTYVKQIYQWKGEMLNGSAANRRDR
jgi:hypothetical protein